MKLSLEEVIAVKTGATRARKRLDDRVRNGCHSREVVADLARLIAEKAPSARLPTGERIGMNRIPCRRRIAIVGVRD